VAFTILVRAIIRADGSSSLVATAIGSEAKGRISLLAYADATVLAFVSPWITYALFVTVAVMWFIPDRRLSRERLTRLLPVQPGRPHQRRADRTEQGAVAVVEPGLLGELLRVQAPPFGEHGQAALALQRWQVGEQLQPGQLQVVTWHGLVEGHHLQVPACARG